MCDARLPAACRVFCCCIVLVFPTDSREIPCAWSFLLCVSNEAPRTLTRALCANLQKLQISQHDVGNTTCTHALLPCTKPMRVKCALRSRLASPCSVMAKSMLMDGV